LIGDIRERRSELMSNAWYSGIAASILTPMVLGWAVNRTRDVSASRDGWRQIRPSGGLYGMILATAAFSLGAFYVYFFVGSARADAERQMFYCLLIAVAFLLATLWACWSTFHESVEWQGDRLRVRPLLGKARSARLQDLESIDYSSLQSMYLFRFRGGWLVKVSPYMHGTRQLLQHIERLAPSAAPERFYAPDDYAD
jgi:hypothetical protein